MESKASVLCKAVCALVDLFATKDWIQNSYAVKSGKNGFGNVDTATWNDEAATGFCLLGGINRIVDAWDEEELLCFAANDRSGKLGLGVALRDEVGKTIVNDDELWNTAFSHLEPGEIDRDHHRANNHLYLPTFNDQDGVKREHVDKLLARTKARVCEPQAVPATV